MNQRDEHSSVTNFILSVSKIQNIRMCAAGLFSLDLQLLMTPIFIIIT